MTTPITTFQDILNALERDPSLRRQLRQHILTEELLNLPALIGQPEEDDATIFNQLKGLHTHVNRIETQAARTDTPVDRINGQTANQEGRVYEEWAASQVHDLLWFALGMQSAEVAYSAASRQGRQDIENFSNALPIDQQLDRIQRQNLFSTDIIVRRLLDSHLTYMAIEASITGGEDDVRRADSRSQLVAKITGLPCRPAIVGASLTRRLSPTILAPQAEFPTIGAQSFNNLPHRNNKPLPEPIRQDVLVLPLEPRE